MVVTQEMELYVSDCLKNVENTGATSLQLDPALSDHIANDASRKEPFGLKLHRFIKEANVTVDKRFKELLLSTVPQAFSAPLLNVWQERLECYMENADSNLEPDERAALKESLSNFHTEVLKNITSEDSDSAPDDFAENAIAAIQFMKNAKLDLENAVSQIFHDDVEVEVKRLLDSVIDNVVLLADGGRPFERVSVDFTNPLTDPKFNQELYDFASAGQTLPDAPEIPWLGSSQPIVSKLLPKDIVQRLSSPLKVGDVENYDDWEYSITHPLEEENDYAEFEWTYQQYRKNLKEVFTKEMESRRTNIDTTASLHPKTVEDAKKRMEDGQIDLDFQSLFVLPYDVNQSKLIAVRDESEGNMITYKEVLKPPSERIMDNNLRSDPEAWVDPERSAGPHVRTFGWEPFADLHEDCPPDETEMIKKKENPDVCVATELNKSAKESMEKRCEALKNEVAQQMSSEKSYNDSIVNLTLYKFLERRGESFGIIPRDFKTPETFLDSLDLPELRAKDEDKSYPLENETIPLNPEWLSLNGTGVHEQLTEELYWKQLQSFKKPASAPLVDWQAILNEDSPAGADSAEKKDIEQYLDEATKVSDNKNQEPENVGETDWQKGEKDTPARKRALDKEFVREWVQKFGDESGIRGFDPRSYKQPEHLVTSEEYDEKFLTYPYTSSHVFHPNFVRFRRMTRNHPTYSEYTFAKYDSQTSPSFFECNTEEFDSILADLQKNGPEKTADQVFQLNEQNLGVDAAEAKTWDVEFSCHMTEGLSLLESFAESSRKAFARPSSPCKEEHSDDLLFSKVKKQTEPQFVKHFKLQPFVLEDFGSLPNESDVSNVRSDRQPSKSVEKTLAASDEEEEESSSDEEKDGAEPSHQHLTWRPFKEFSGYKGTNVVQLLYDAAQLIETKAPKEFHPSPKITKWIEGTYQPSTRRIKEWRKAYSVAFPNVESPLKTPYLFLSDEQRLERLNPSVETVNKEPAEGSMTWVLTEQEKLEMQNLSSKKEVEEVDAAQQETNESKAVQEKILKIVNLGKEPTKTEWAEELDTSEAPDMSVLGTPAMTFPFELDNFQKQAIMALENGYNVFVSAHTSAGKTVVAEYAIAMSRKRRSRAIYTSPIKALSNQKYKDFKTTFDSVGLITGDVQLNETADCLIMTTEILRSMLYNSSEGIRDLEFVVLDEVHFMNDRERGHVWEEVLILLPANVQIVMLSATVPNTMDFASWVGRSKQRKVMVCKTQHRPVPLVHFFYVDVFKLNIKDPSQGLFELKNGDNPLKKHEWNTIHELITEINKIEKMGRRGVMKKFDAKEQDMGSRKQGAYKMTVEDAMKKDTETKTLNSELMKYFARKQKTQWENFINYLKKIDWLPTIVFVFSRKKCDELPQQLSLDLTTDEEKQKILSFIASQVEKLEPEDQNLPQIKMMRKFLKNGIGVHHSGILPVLKEIVEVLFQAGIVKLLFATETFAMGVNMPARTVVFNTIDKFDGTASRYLLPAEYIQMAGRAGRRDKDTVGNVIIRCPSRGAETLTIDKIEAMMTGSPEILKSQFRVSYRMILSTLTARSQISAINMMARSFYENKEQQKLMLRKSDLRAIEEEETKQRVLIHSRFQKSYIDSLTNIYNTIEECLILRCKIRAQVLVYGKFVKDIAPGRFVKFNCGPLVNKVGVILRVMMKNTELTVMTLKEDDQSVILESPSSDTATDIWYRFLSLLPLPPAEKRRSNDLNMSVVLFKITPEEIVDVYKENVDLTSDRVAIFIRDINHSSIGGRLTVPLQMAHYPAGQVPSVPTLPTSSITPNHSFCYALNVEPNPNQRELYFVNPPITNKPLSTFPNHLFGLQPIVRFPSDFPGGGFRQSVRNSIENRNSTEWHLESSSSVHSQFKTDRRLPGNPRGATNRDIAELSEVSSSSVSSTLRPEKALLSDQSAKIDPLCFGFTTCTDKGELDHSDLQQATLEPSVSTKSTTCGSGKPLFDDSTSRVSCDINPLDYGFILSEKQFLPDTDNVMLELGSPNSSPISPKSANMADGSSKPLQDHSIIGANPDADPLLFGFVESEIDAPDTLTKTTNSKSSAFLSKPTKRLFDLGSDGSIDCDSVGIDCMKPLNQEINTRLVSKTTSQCSTSSVCSPYHSSVGSGNSRIDPSISLFSASSTCLDAKHKVNHSLIGCNLEKSSTKLDGKSATCFPSPQSVTPIQRPHHLSKEEPNACNNSANRVCNFNVSPISEADIGYCSSKFTAVKDSACEPPLQNYQKASVSNSQQPREPKESPFYSKAYETPAAFTNASRTVHVPGGAWNTLPGRPLLYHPTPGPFHPAPAAPLNAMPGMHSIRGTWNQPVSSMYFGPPNTANWTQRLDMTFPSGSSCAPPSHAVNFPLLYAMNSLNAGCSPYGSQSPMGYPNASHRPCHPGKDSFRNSNEQIPTNSSSKAHPLTCPSTPGVMNDLEMGPRNPMSNIRPANSISGVGHPSMESRIAPNILVGGLANCFQRPQGLALGHMNYHEGQSLFYVTSRPQATQDTFQPLAVHVNSYQHFSNLNKLNPPSMFPFNPHNMYPRPNVPLNYSQLPPRPQFIPWNRQSSFPGPGYMTQTSPAVLIPLNNAGLSKSPRHDINYTGTKQGQCPRAGTNTNSDVYSPPIKSIIEIVFPKVACKKTRGKVVQKRASSKKPIQISVTIVDPKHAEEMGNLIETLEALTSVNNSNPCRFELLIKSCQTRSALRGSRLPPYQRQVNCGPPDASRFLSPASNPPPFRSLSTPQWFCPLGPNRDLKHKTKLDSELESLCLRLNSPYLLKPIGEMAYAKDCAYEHYQLLKFKEEALADLIAETNIVADRRAFISTFSTIFAWKEIGKKKELLVQKVSEETMSLYPEYSKKMTILRRMNYVVNDSVQMKGYMAARISKYEVVVTEILLRNVIQNLTPEEVAGLMSFIVFQPRSIQLNPKAEEEEEVKPPSIVESLPALQEAIASTKAIIEEILQEESTEGLTSEELQKLLEAFGLTDIMYSWAKQKSFAKVVGLSKYYQEGMLVRWIQQLVEALKEIESAARVMGDPAVPEKILAAIKAIKRGIVFTPSLYTTL